MSDRSPQDEPAPSKWRLRLVLLAVMSVAAAVCGVFIEPDRLVVRTHDIEVPQLTTPLTVAVLTDLHVGAPHIDARKLARVVAETNAREPDVVVILGDLVIHGVTGGEFVEPEAIASELGRLRAPLGVFAVLGNHDWWYDGPRVTAALEGVGITVLANDSHRCERPDADPVWIAGVEDLWTRTVDMEAALRDVPPGAPALLLTHSPDVFPSVPAEVSITLAGHTHGGQVRLPFVGPPIVPSSYGARYAEGHVVEDGRNLFVSTGIGTSIFPVRMFVVPRIDLLTLR